MRHLSEQHAHKCTLQFIYKRITFFSPCIKSAHDQLLMGFVMMGKLTNQIICLTHVCFLYDLPLDFSEDDATYWALYFSGLQLGNQTFVKHLLNKSLLLNKGMQTVAVFNNELKSNLFVLDICRAVAMISTWYNITRFLLVWNQRTGRKV